MNREISAILKDRIVAANLPYLSDIAGMVQTVEYAQENADGSKFPVQRLPVAYDTNIEACGENEIREQALCPDSSKAGILYFEDLGIVNDGNKAYGSAYRSSLLLVCWFNREKITGNNYSHITAKAINDIVRAMGKNPFNASPFIRVQVLVDGVQIQDAGVFSKYSYDESISQYLMPPFDFFALRLTVKYVVSNKCIEAMAMNPIDCGQPPVTADGEFDKGDYSGNEYF